MSEKKTYPQSKIDQIKELEGLIKAYKVIGLTKLDGVSSNVLQNIRGALRGDTEIKVSKNTLKRLSINNLPKKYTKVKKLLPYLEGNSALIFSNRDAFSLQRYFNANRINVSAKPGQIASDEVYVPAGPTDMAPGPVIGELNSIGIRTSVEAGKVKINQDTKILDPGDEISETHASIMARLGIKPLKMGISLHLALESGDLLFEKDLNIDEDEIMTQLKLAMSYGINLSLKTGYPTERTINNLLNLAHFYANNLAMETGYPTKDNINLLLTKAYGQAVAIENLKN
ncbi:MAG: 50S ribosomal protein L10 [Candidatus Hodarchaeales archaeon]|jgi:large subunit ribosomal protein L10